MRYAKYCAVLAFLMIFGIAGCMEQGTAAHYNRAVSSAEKTALERNGVHDGSRNSGALERTMGADWQDYNRFLNESARKGAVTPGAWNREMTAAGQRSMQSVENTGRGVVKRVEDAGRSMTENAKKGMENADQMIQSKGMEKVG